MLIVYILPPERSKATTQVSGFQPGAVFKDKYFTEKKEGGDEKKSRIPPPPPPRSHCLPHFWVPESETHLLARSGTSSASLTLTDSTGSFSERQSTWSSVRLQQTKKTCLFHKLLIDYIPVSSLLYKNQHFLQTFYGSGFSLSHPRLQLSPFPFYWE